MSSARAEGAPVVRCHTVNLPLRSVLAVINYLWLCQMLNSILPNLDVLQIMAGSTCNIFLVVSLCSSSDLLLSPIPPVIYGLEVLFSGNIIAPTLMPARCVLEACLR